MEKRLDVMKVSYVPSELNGDAEPQLLISILRTHSSRFQTTLETFVRKPLIGKYMRLYTKEPLLFPTRIGPSDRTYSYGYGMSGRMFYDQYYLNICISLSPESVKESAITAMVTFEALRQMFETNSSVNESSSPIYIHPLCVDQPGGYSISGSFTQTVGQWFNGKHYMFPEQIAWHAEHALFETQAFLTPESMLPVYIDCEARVAHDGRFCLSVRGDTRTAELFSADPFDESGSVTFQSSSIESPVEFLTLLSGISAMSSFLYT